MAVLCSQGRYDEADALYLRAIEVLEKALGPDHAWLAIGLNNRANVTRDQVIDLPCRRRLYAYNDA